MASIAMAGQRQVVSRGRGSILERQRYVTKTSRSSPACMIVAIPAHVLQFCNLSQILGKYTVPPSGTDSATPSRLKHSYVVLALAAGPEFTTTQQTVSRLGSHCSTLSSIITSLLHQTPRHLAKSTRPTFHPFTCSARATRLPSSASRLG
jgi:hypothetical protein